MDKTVSTTKPIAIILAAGLSRRMGRPKSELAWGNGTLVTHVVRLTREHMGWVTVLVRSPFLAPLQGVVDIVNPSPEKGIAESLRLGLEVVLNRHDSLPIAIFLADQPFVQARDTTEVWTALLQHPEAMAARPKYNGRIGHPVLIRSNLLASIMKDLSGDQGLGSWLGKRSDVLTVDIAVGSRPNPAWDLDTPEDYALALAWHEQGEDTDGPKHI